MPKKTRYLLIGLFFSALTIMAIVAFIKSEKSKRTLSFIVFFGAVAALFLKNSLFLKD